MEYEIRGCGGVLQKPEGHFTSPNYPNQYPHDTHCQWAIQVDYGYLIEITFRDFDFEASIGCLQDGLVVCCIFQSYLFSVAIKIFNLLLGMKQKKDEKCFCYSFRYRMIKMDQK